MSSRTAGPAGTPGKPAGSATRPPRGPAAAALAPATISEFDGVRYLHLDTVWVQGAMRIRKPRQLELEYVQRMMAWLLWCDRLAPDAGQVAHLGLGAGALARFTHQVMRWPTTVVELNPSVIAANRQWFHLPPDDERFSLVQADAAQWLEEPGRTASLDALTVDLYDHEAAAPVLDDEAFYAACFAALKPGGLLAVNLFGRQASFARSLARIGAAFGPGQVWYLAPTQEGNTIVVAGRELAEPDRHALDARAERIRVWLSLPAPRWLRLIKRWRGDPQAPAPAAPAG